MTDMDVKTAVAAERAACARIADLEVTRLIQLRASVALGRRAEKWAGGAIAAQAIADTIRKRGT